MSKMLILAGLFVALVGCAELRAIQASIAVHGAEGSDATLEAAIWTICNGIPVGAKERRFRTEAEKAAWGTLCPAP